jgi:hypothetical protein
LGGAGWCAGSLSRSADSCSFIDFLPTRKW